MKILFCSIAFMCLNMAATSQQSTVFYVVNTKGNSYYFRDKYQIPVKIGSALALNDHLILDRQSEVTIICNNYSLITIANESVTTKKTIPLYSYKDSCRTPNSGVTFQFFKYLLQHFKEEDVAVNKPERDNIKEYGAAERGCADAAFDRIRDTIAVFQMPFSIKYYPLDTAAHLQFVMFDEQMTDTLYKSDVHNTRINISNKVISLIDTGKIYNWVVVRNGIQLCEPKTLRKISTSEYENIISSFDKKSFTALSRADKATLLSFLLNEKNVVAEAGYYLKMIKVKKGNALQEILEEKLRNEFVY